MSLLRTERIGRVALLTLDALKQPAFADLVARLESRISRK
jgi:hypothetical protein